MKILVVDDSKAMRMIVTRTLRQAGFDNYTVQEACNGVEALKAIHDAAPDLILCDWNMPEMSGIELLANIRAEQREIKFGFVTSEGTDEMRAQALESGALFLITKPFTPDAFRIALRSVIS